jgi:hypothetical protein
MDLSVCQTGPCWKTVPSCSVAKCHQVDDVEKHVAIVVSQATPTNCNVSGVARTNSLSCLGDAHVSNSAGGCWLFIIASRMAVLPAKAEWVLSAKVLVELEGANHFSGPCWKTVPSCSVAKCHQVDDVEKHVAIVVSQATRTQLYQLQRLWGCSNKFVVLLGRPQCCQGVLTSVARDLRDAFAELPDEVSLEDMIGAELVGC